MINGQLITIQAQAADGPDTLCRDIRRFAIFFPCKYIGDMNFYNRYPDGGNSVRQADAGMGIGAGIQDNAVLTGPAGVQVIDQLTFDITLKITQPGVWVLHGQLVKIAFKSLTAINSRLTGSQQVEIRSVNNSDGRHKSECSGKIMILPGLCREAATAKNVALSWF